MKNRIAPYMEGENNKSIYAWVRRALHDYMSGGSSPSMAVAFAPYNVYFMTQEDTGKQFYNFVEAMEQEEQKEVLDAMKSVLYDLLEIPYKDEIEKNPGMRECMIGIFAAFHAFRKYDAHEWLFKALKVFKDAVIVYNFNNVEEFHRHVLYWPCWELRVEDIEKWLDNEKEYAEILEHLRRVDPELLNTKSSIND